MNLFDGESWFVPLKYNDFFGTVVCRDVNGNEVDVFLEDISAVEDKDGNIFGPGVLNDSILFGDI